MFKINNFLIRGFEIINLVVAAFIAIVMGVITFQLAYDFFHYEAFGLPGNSINPEHLLPLLAAVFVGVVSGIVSGGLIATLIETRKELTLIRKQLTSKE